MSRIFRKGDFEAVIIVQSVVAREARSASREAKPEGREAEHPWFLLQGLKFKLP